MIHLTGELHLCEPGGIPRDDAPGPCIPLTESKLQAPHIKTKPAQSNGDGYACGATITALPQHDGHNIDGTPQDAPQRNPKDRKNYRS